jgi:hypothetical protein
MTTGGLNFALMDIIQPHCPHISVRLLETVRYAVIKCSPVILEQYDRLPSGYAKTDQHSAQSQYHQPPSTRTMPVDLAGKVNGMYRLLDVVGESGSNGHGM